VLLVPTGEAPHRRIEPEPGREVRLELARVAAAEDELLAASDIEVRAAGPSYTVRTLSALREAGPGDELVFLMGADVAASLESWHEPQRVLELARIGVAARPGTALGGARAAVERLGGGERMDVIGMPELAISSSEVRRRVAEGRPIRYLVPAAVERFVAERGLYR
jgi:nicotinate-nucleotide adenylyltransferase